MVRSNADNFSCMGFTGFHADFYGLPLVRFNSGNDSEEDSRGSGSSASDDDHVVGIGLLLFCQKFTSFVSSHSSI